MRTRLLSLIALLAIILNSCQFNSSYTNREEDRDAAEAVVSQIYELMRARRYADTYPFFSERFLEVTDTSQIKSIYVQCDTLLGNLEDRTLVNWKTNSVVGTNPKTEYLLEYEVKRPKWDSKETWILEKEGEKIKVLKYNVDSDYFHQQRNRSAN